MRCERTTDAAAYVLGALSPAERESYQRHLDHCAPCRKAVTAFAPIPGLLGRLTPAQVEAGTGPADAATESGSSGPATEETGPATEETGPPRLSDGSLSRLLTAAARERRREHARRARRTVSVLVAAACLVGVAWVAALFWFAPEDDGPVGSPGPSVTMVAMRPVAGQEYVSAEVAFVEEPWGTRIEMRCWYASGTPSPAATPRRWEYELVVVGVDGSSEVVSSWAVLAGEEPRVSGTTRLPVAEIAQVVVRRPAGRAVLTLTP